MKTQPIYHRDADILEVFFSDVEPTASVSLTPDIILHFRVEDERATSLIFNNFSVLIEHDKFGPRMFRLQAERWPVRWRPIVWRILAASPVKDWLATTSYRPPRLRRSVPLATIKRAHRITQIA